MLRALIAAVVLLAPSIAVAQSDVQAPLVITPPNAHRGYWNAGYVRIPTTVDGLSIQGDGYTVTGGGLGLGLHAGVTQKWYVDATAGGHFGGANVDRPSGSERANYLGWYLTATAGRKLYIDERLFVVAFGGLSRAEAFLDYSGTDGTDPNQFSVTTSTTCVPAGVFATWGERVHVSPALSVNYVFAGDMRARVGEPGASVRSKETFDPFLTWTAGVDVGWAPGGQYLGLFWTQTPAVAEEAGPHGEILLRFTWAVKANKLK